MKESILNNCCSHELGNMSVAALAVDIIVVSHGSYIGLLQKMELIKLVKISKVSCKYTAPATFDMVEMAKLIDNAVSQKPKGIEIYFT